MDVKKNTVNIIVTGYGITKEVREAQAICITRVEENTVYPYVLTYYDNYTFGETLTDSWNFYCYYSPCEYICLLNNDTEVSQGWLKKLVEVFDKEDRCGFVGPSTNSCHSPQKKISTEEKALAHEGRWEEMGDPISGFCLLFKKSLWEELDGFDPRYKHYGQESDFIDRAHRLGYRSFWRLDSFVFHHGEMSVKASEMDVDKARQEAKKIYWGDRR